MSISKLMLQAAAGNAGEALPPPPNAIMVNDNWLSSSHDSKYRIVSLDGTTAISNTLTVGTGTHDEYRYMTGSSHGIVQYQPFSATTLTSQSAFNIRQTATDGSTIVINNLGSISHASYGSYSLAVSQDGLSMYQHTQNDGNNNYIYKFTRPDLDSDWVYISTMPTNTTLNFRSGEAYDPRTAFAVVEGADDLLLIGSLGSNFIYLVDYSTGTILHTYNTGNTIHSFTDTGILNAAKDKFYFLQQSYVTNAGHVYKLYVDLTLQTIGSAGQVWSVVDSAYGKGPAIDIHNKYGWMHTRGISGDSMRLIQFNEDGGHSVLSTGTGAKNTYANYLYGTDTHIYIGTGASVTGFAISNLNTSTSNNSFTGAGFSVYSAVPCVITNPA